MNPESQSPPVFDNDEGSDSSDIALLQDRSNGTYLSDAYYPAPYLFDDEDYMFDLVLFFGGL